jgi:hypothetical protein
MAHQMLQYKAEEAGTRLHLAKTRQLKLSQRCSACWAVVPETLNERTHRCDCGCELRGIRTVPRSFCWTPGRLDAATLARDGRYGEPKTANRESGQVKVEAP